MDPIETEEEYQDKRSELIQEAKETKQDLEQEQREILEEISSEHGGELVETTATITGDHTATVSLKLNGEFINRMGRVQEKIDYAQSEGSLQSIEETMDEAATILADITEEATYDKDLFYNVYLLDGPEALGNIIERVFSAVEEEQERKAGAVDGFRKE